jgi:hypothetical protein
MKSSKKYLIDFLIKEINHITPKENNLDEFYDFLFDIDKPQIVFILKSELKFYKIDYDNVTSLSIKKNLITLDTPIGKITLDKNIQFDIFHCILLMAYGINEHHTFYKLIEKKLKTNKEITFDEYNSIENKLEILL